jgi:glutaminyl-tRNA synthetase
MSDIEKTNFIQNIINEDLKEGKNDGKVHTRFPPEPNGYLHIGHAKSICLNFGLAKEFNGKCNLRFDDTDPSKEDVEYVESIQEDIQWLGFQWDGEPLYASDYFDQLHAWAIELIRKGKAYVCSLNPEQMREYRGTLKEPGKDSPDRNRPVEENLDLFERMGKGEFEEGQYTLRAKIDMASPNMNMRDPAIYRIKKMAHYRAGDKWCIYPMYDFAHGQSDSIEGITHSVCTLEFEDHRPLYDWFLENLSVPCKPRQIEFARLNLNYTMMSKRRLLELVETKVVDGWDDPRMPTISGLRRRGYTAESIREFCDRIGVAKANSTVDIALLEHCLREDLEVKAKRVMGVLNPLKVVITNFPEDQEEELTCPYHQENADMGSRKVPFSRELYIEQDDFMEDPPKKFFRLAPGKEIRLKYAYYVKCNEVIKDDSGSVIEVHCTYDPATKGGWSKDGRKVKGTSHWVSAKHALKTQVRLYDRLFKTENPYDYPEGGNYKDNLNPDSLQILDNCYVEPSLKNAQAGEDYQFERTGYFAVDNKHSQAGQPVFNRAVSLKDSWAKLKKKLGTG